MSLSIEALVSVVIPTYNRASLISKTISSIIAQTYRNLEIIVVSDGPGLETKNVLESFKDSRLKYYEINHSGRPAVPRNFGIMKAKGEYIALCDDDDVWMPEKITLQVAKIVSDNNIGLVYTQCILQEKKGERIVPIKGKEGKIFEDLFLSFCFIATSTVLIKKEVVDKIGMFDEDMRLKVVEDFDYWLRIARYYHLASIDKPLVVHREGQDSISNSNIFARWRRQYVVPYKFYTHHYVGMNLFIRKIVRVFCGSILDLLQVKW